MLGAALQNQRGSSEGCRTQTDVLLALSAKLLNCSLIVDRRVLQASSCSSSFLCRSDPDKEEGQLAGRESRGFDRVTEAIAVIVHLQDFLRTSLWSRHLSAGNTGGLTFSLKIHPVGYSARGWNARTRNLDLPPVKSLRLVWPHSVFCQAPSREQTLQLGFLSSAKWIFGLNRASYRRRNMTHRCSAHANAMYTVMFFWHPCQIGSNAGRAAVWDVSW